MVGQVVGREVAGFCPVQVVGVPRQSPTRGSRDGGHGEKGQDAGGMGGGMEPEGEVGRGHFPGERAG